MRYKMIVSYDGSFFHGFQRQKNDVSVQEVLEEKLTEILKTNIVVHASGRTDAGVHAIGQVIHFDSSQYVPVLNLKKILNKKVYPHIYITSAEMVDESFHSRKSARLKEYHYFVSINTFDPFKANYLYFFHDRIDLSKIREAMEYIVGTHDFRSFSKNKTISSCIRTITKFDLIIKDGILEFVIIGSGFMYNMVRIIIALMLKVGAPQISVVPLSSKLKDNPVHVIVDPSEIRGYALSNRSDFMPEDIQTLNKGCVRFKSGYIPGESEIREAMDRAMIMQLNLLPVARKMVLEELEMKQNG